MKFSNPVWLLAGLLTCIFLLWTWRRYDARQNAALARFVSAHLRQELTRSISATRRWLQRGLLLAALACLFAALAGPLVGFRWEQISRRGNDIVFAIDTSRSMSTPDVKPSRLVRAKLAIDDMARQMDGDALGIVAFAGTAFLACPLTLDYGAFHESLGAIDTHTIPRGGTNISSAIEEAAAALRRRPGSDKIMILVTDGEDLEGSALTAAQSASRQDGLKIFTVGVGTAAGDLIPIPAQQGGGFVKDDTGALVKSQLDEAALKAIAGAAGGRYVPLGSQGEGLEVIARTILGTTAKHDLAYRQQRIYTPRYQWPLAASLGFLLASLMIGTRRWGTAWKTAKPRVAAAAGLLAILVATLYLPRSTQAATQTNDPPAASAAAASAPAASAPQSATKEPVIDYNAGTAAYRAGQFPQATQAFQQSIKHAPSSDLKRLADQQDAYYNLGNALYRAGQKTEKSSREETLQKWNDAVKAYDTALQLRADDMDSKFNRDLVKRKIDALNKPPPDPQQNPQNNPQQNPGNGKGPPPPGQPPSQGQPPPQGQPPQKQPPPQQQPGQPRSGQPPAGQPPPMGGDPKAADAKADQQPQNADQSSDAEEKQADSQRLPGQMSREEARELLDSAKSEERKPPGAPAAMRNAFNDPPEKPFKNW